MFYLVNGSSAATFQLGFIEKDDVAVTLLEGNSVKGVLHKKELLCTCLLYTSPSPRDKRQSRMPSSA